MSSTTAHSDLTTSLDGSETADRARRFGGIARLYGAPALAAFEGAHVAVIGIGGVGSWVAEALARSAVGTLTLIDLDNVAESNTNRQIHALDGNYGKPKVEAMAERVDRVVRREEAAVDYRGRCGWPTGPDAHSDRRSRVDHPGSVAIESARAVAQTAWLSAWSEGEVQGERGVFR